MSIEELDAGVSRLRERIAALEEALVPFAEAADAAESMRVVKGASDEARYGIRMGDLRKARALLPAEGDWMACPNCGDDMEQVGLSDWRCPSCGEESRVLPFRRDDAGRR